MSGMLAMLGTALASYLGSGAITGIIELGLNKLFGNKVGKVIEKVKEINPSANVVEMAERVPDAWERMMNRLESDWDKRMGKIEDAVKAQAK